MVCTLPACCSWLYELAARLARASFFLPDRVLSGAFSANVLNKQVSLSCPYTWYRVVTVVGRGCR